MVDEFQDLREEYERGKLTKNELDLNPFEQFRIWFEEAVSENISLANGMSLATVDKNLQPSVRTVLLKSYDERGFVFFTNYESRKAQCLQSNPRASLLFWWSKLERQISIEGVTEKISGEESDAYFDTRPRASNISAMASPQSQEVEDRGVLLKRAEQLQESWSGKELVRPENWGGYRIVPTLMEFWQGRSDRLHDRFVYKRTEAGWQLVQLAP